MKVGVNTLFLIPGEVGGTETYLRQTLIAMAENCPDVELLLYTNYENDPVLKSDLRKFPNVRYEYLNFWATNRYARIIREQTELPMKVRRTKPDILWSPGYTAVRFCPCPQVVTIHDMQYKSHPNDMTPIARWTTDMLVNMAAKHCRRIIAVSQFSKEEIIKYTHVPADKVDVVLEAVKPEFSAALAARPGAMPKEVGDMPFILCVSNTYPHKNIHALVDSFGRIMNGIRHNLVLVGTPRFGEEKVQEAIAGIQDKRRIIRFKWLPHEQLIVLYHKASVFVFPSLYEGFGLPVLEAMMAGLPVVAAKRGSVPEVGADTITYFDPETGNDLDARIKQILDWNDPQRKEVVDKARKRASSFTWKQTALQTVETFKKALR